MDEIFLEINNKTDYLVLINAYYSFSKTKIIPIFFFFEKQRKKKILFPVSIF